MNSNEKSGWIVIGICAGAFIGLVILAALFAPGFRVPERMRCLGNLRQLEIATAAWADQHKKPPGTAVTTNDLLPFIAKRAIFHCPEAGAYTLGPVGGQSRCGVHGR